MTAKEKFMEEKDEMKLLRMNRILASAFKLFSVKGIDTIAMTDIAKHAEIGVASLYRYYETKDEIAIRTVIWAWEKQREMIMPSLTSDEYNKLTGLDQLGVIFNQFIELYENHQDFLRFIYFFDSYAVRNELSKDRLADYEKIIADVQDIVNKAIDKGLEDKSIRSEYRDSKLELYFATMHSFFSQCQKISLSGHMLSIDEKSNKKAELEMLSKVLLNGISSK